MKKGTLIGLVFTLLFAFVISFAQPSLSQYEQMEEQKQQIQQPVEQQKQQMMQKKEMMKEMMGKKQIIEGNVICVEVDEKGSVNGMDQFTECDGVFMVVGKDGKLYTVYGTEQQMKMMAKSPKKKVSGQVGGSQRAWVIYGSPLDIQKGTQQTVTGTIVCLLPSYEKGNVTPVVSTGPCNEAKPHAHVIYTKDGQMYAIGGSEEAIGKIESNPQRSNVTLSGKVVGNQGAWILYVE